MAVNVTTDQSFEQDTATGVALIDFWATWCGPCRMQSPVVEALSEEMPDVNFFKLDVDQNPATAQQFRIMSIPTLMIKKDGQVVDQIVGYHPKEQLQQILQQYTA
ncbi:MULTISPECIES: thioredoxin [Limosilactobacillus]|jgi:thioredoxin 1|uniref:Thioredoxin n=1 Tax=Limosilactobacillus pontis TaxID=35787 RepID=A0ABU7SSX6_9LACO|nr:thioredoxin [Limosilactobacillus pontis]MCX2186828.1 thioredoxin [Limosilactobacillus pontis]MCX2188628.1 thioredoxin [Limosilactobacillus pontis]